MELTKLVLKKIKSKVKNERVLLIGILILAFILRLYHFSHPVADWHSFRQADTASVTREYVKAGKIDLLRPQYHDLSNIQSGFENPEGYRMVEFPFINGVIAQTILWGQKLGLSLDLVKTSRIFSILASLLAIYTLFRLLKTLGEKRLGLLAAFIYAVLPYAVFYGRVILPEPFMLAFSILSLWQWAQFCQHKKKGKAAWINYLISLITLALALLLKPFVAVLAPVYLSITFYFLGKKTWQLWPAYLYPLFAFLPLLIWRQWILNFPSGIPASDWLLNGNNIRLRPAWFRWLFYERLTKIFFGYTGLIFILANSCQKKKSCWIYSSWWLAIILYFIIVASGNVQHDYYQNLVIPIAAISIARGIIILDQKFRRYSWRKAVLALILASSLFFAGKQTIGWFNVNHWAYIEAGAAVDRLTPPDALIIAPAMGDTVFLFQTKRRGWPIGFSLEKKIAQGASIYVSTDDDNERRELEAKYQILEKSENYSIIDLTQEQP